MRFLALLFAAAISLGVSGAQAQPTDLKAVLEVHAEQIERPKRLQVGAVVDDLIALGTPEVTEFLQRWQNRELHMREADRQFFYVGEGTPIELIDVFSGQVVGTAEDSELKQLRPNAGVRRVLGSALVQFQLSDPNILRRVAAVDSIARRPQADQLAPLLASIPDEPDAALKERKERLAGLLTARFGETTDARVAAIEALSGELSLDVQAVMNQILATRDAVAVALPEDENIAEIYEVGADLGTVEAYAQLVSAELAPAVIPNDAIRNALAANIDGGFVGGVPVAQLNTAAARATAYTDLAEAGTVPPLVTDADISSAVQSHVFYAVYTEPVVAVTDAANDALNEITTRVGMNQALDLTLDGLSLASIYFLAAIGLAITFGVMGVINMAHGEFIMMGAYTGYVVQLFIPDYTLSILIALPLAFAVTFGAGVAMERLVIRWLYHRPLETLLATFGISIALQQLAKNIFGTQARPLTSPGWLDGAWVMNDVVSISYIRIAIFILALIFLGLLLFILNKTRLGLEVRAVTQNPGMAASMGINPDRINMLTFGLGSGIAGIAGVAIGLYAKVTSEMGADYIVQSFMTVVVGGVGNVWGTLAGASLIGFLQKGIEWFNPANTLAAQTYMILFIILFIQFRPKGIVALKGRAAGD